MVLDADMIAEPHLLRALLPHLLRDPKWQWWSLHRYSLLQHKFFYNAYEGCQDAYNIPMDDPLYQSLAAQNNIGDIVRDGIGAAWCTGSGFVFRQSALKWFPTESLAEDILSSHLLIGGGHGVAYVHESLQWGLVPNHYASHISQRSGWVRFISLQKPFNFAMQGSLIFPFVAPRDSPKRRDSQLLSSLSFHTRYEPLATACGHDVLHLSLHLNHPDQHRPAHSTMPFTHRPTFDSLCTCFATANPPSPLSRNQHNWSRPRIHIQPLVRLSLAPSSHRGQPLAHAIPCHDHSPIPGSPPLQRSNKRHLALSNL